MSEHSLDTDVVADVPTVGHALTVETLIRDYHQSLYRYAYRLSGQPCDAEDLTQQTFLTAHQKLHQLRDEAAVRGWLFRILRTTFLKNCRKRKPLSEADTELAMSDVVDAGDVELRFDTEHLQHRLDELPESYRVALLMFYFEQKSYEEIASELDLPMGTVMSRLSRAKARLRTRLRSVEQMSERTA